MSRLYIIAAAVGRYGRAGALGLIIYGGISSSTRAQTAPSTATPTPVAKPGNNIVRLDLLSPVGYNMAYNALSDRGLVFPVLVSYERHLQQRWSLGAEILLNGGTPEQRRAGAGIMGRYYVLPRKRNAAPLAGWYVSPVLHYRKFTEIMLRTEDKTYITSGSRLRPGLLGGWQRQFGATPGRGIVLDVAVGGVYSHRLGTDREDDQGITSSVFAESVEVDMRVGIGYQF